MTDPDVVLIGEPEDNGKRLIPLRGISPARAATLARIVRRDHDMDINIDTAAGRDNRLAILDFIDGSFRLCQAQRRIGISDELSRAVHAANMATLAAHLRASGLTDAEVEQLIHKYRDLPPDVA